MICEKCKVELKEDEPRKIINIKMKKNEKYISVDHIFHIDCIDDSEVEYLMK